MGRVIVTLRIENLVDLYDADQGDISVDQVRSIEIPDAVVDLETTGVGLPSSLIAKLGLEPWQSWRAETMYGIVRLTIQGRDCSSDVVGLPDDWPVTIGRMTLLALDLVVDEAGERLMGNPDHGGEPMLEIFGHAV